MARRGLLVAAVVVVLLPVGGAGGALPDPSLVRVYRDGFGVPHVVASSPRAMAYGAGYVLGTDRLFETDVIRRLAQGRLSEVLGAAMLPADQQMRQEFYDPADVARQYRELPASVRSLLEAFAAGFNRALAEQELNPLEKSVLFAALGYEPEPWRPEDSVSVLMLFTMVFFAGEGASGELENAKLLGDLLAEGRSEQEALAVWNDLLLRNDPSAPAVVDEGEGPPPATLSAAAPAPEQVALAREPTVPVAARVERERLEALRTAVRDLPVPRIGSYGVAATGPRTASGKGLLLGSPQAGFTAPSIFYELGLHAPGIDCEGFTVPGLGPFVGIGWCNGHAWTLVAGNAGDQVDTYVERLCRKVGGVFTGYLFRGECRPLSTREETYLVKSTVSGQPPQVVREVVASTVHGPIFFRDDERGIAYTHRRSQRGHFARTFLGSLALNAGRSLGEVTAGLREITATYNLLYADEDGNIAYRFTGWQPVRHPAVDHRLPTPGEGDHEWVSPRLGFDAMPHVVNPARGILHVNQGIDSKPIWWWPRASDVFVGRVGHLEGDKRLFAGVGGLGVESMGAMNRTLISDTDTVTPRLAGLVEQAADGVPPESELGRAFALFRAWRDRGYPRRDDDGDGLLDDPGVTLFGADYLGFPRSPLWDRFIEKVWVPLAGRPPRGPYIGRLGQTLAAVESPQLFSRPYGAGAAAKLRDALAEALEELRPRFQGKPLEQWLVPVPTVEFSPIGVVAPPALRVVDHGTYSQIVDLGEGRGVNVLPPGNGRADRALDVALNAATGAFPSHFTDQLALYERFAFKPMLMRPVDYTAADPSPELVVYPGA